MDSPLVPVVRSLVWAAPEPAMPELAVPTRAERLAKEPEVSKVRGPAGAPVRVPAECLWEGGAPTLVLEARLGMGE